MSKRTESTPSTGSKYEDLHPRVLENSSQTTKTQTKNTENDASSNSNSSSASLLRNSMMHLERYRKFQAKILSMRLEVFKKAVIAKYGSLDKIEKTAGAPIESKTDIDIIERLCQLQTFVTLPVHDKTGTSITHFYTIGLWYYWGLPELIISFKNPIRENVDFINTITNIIHDELFHMYKDRVVSTQPSDPKITPAPPSIARLDFEAEPETLKVVLDKFDLEFDLKRVPLDNYMGTKTVYMMWFYMFYMDAVNDANGQPKVYPIYQIDIDEGQFRSACKKVIDALMKSAVEQSSMSIPSSLETVDEDSDTDSEISQDLQATHMSESVQNREFSYTTSEGDNSDDVENLDDESESDSESKPNTETRDSKTAPKSSATSSI
ncbi:hypothetical protein YASMINEVIRUS_159 [Yasminevirus sp. GU-2018]|uniref:Uncharacterized protein n=1 Tax=Yasminevirus sp. GU-2018 TaxID=2420051 RepID=A0A5K0U992_9VIRU|nr:hypothetical protein YASMINEVIRUS_159 [Yasminevirus sp. GU-2018]